MGNEINIKNNLPFSGQPVRKSDFAAQDKKVITVFKRYDKDKNGTLDSAEVKKAQEEIYSFCDVMSASYPSSISLEGRKKMKSKGIDFESLVKFEQKLSLSAYSDGEISASFQGPSGNCWVLAGINALNKSQKGREQIKNSIKDNNDGTYSVKLNGVNREYLISREKISRSHKLLSKGDFDVKLLEAAVAGYNAELIQSGKGSDDASDLANYVGNSTLKAPFAGGGQHNRMIFLITGNEGETYTQQEYISDNDVNKSRVISENAVMNALSKLGGNTVLATSFKKAAGVMKYDHTFTVSRTDKNFVYIIDPWNSKVELPVKKEDFVNNVETLCVTTLK